MPSRTVSGWPDGSQEPVGSGGASGLACSMRPVELSRQSRIGGVATSASPPSGSAASANPAPRWASLSVSVSWESTPATSRLAATALKMASAAT